jgi:hypothetical protein
VLDLIAHRITNSGRFETGRSVEVRRRRGDFSGNRKVEAVIHLWVGRWFYDCGKLRSMHFAAAAAYGSSLAKKRLVVQSRVSTCGHNACSTGPMMDDLPGSADGRIDF